MKLYRIKPGFDTDENRAAIFNGASLAVVSIMITLALCSYLPHGIERKDILGIIFTVIIVPFEIFMAVIGILLALGGIGGIKKKNAWKKHAAVGQAAIIDRSRGFYEPDYDTGGYYVYGLELKLDTVQTGSPSDQQSVLLKVSKRVFKKYKHKDTARIYYSMAAPLNFIVEGE
jgi:hypothetical protein